MKLFWSFILVALLAGGAYVGVTSRPVPKAKPTQPALAGPSDPLPSAPEVVAITSQPPAPVIQVPKAEPIAAPAPSAALAPAPAPAPTPPSPPANQPDVADDAVMPEKIDGYEVIPALVEHHDDGTTTLDGRYTLKGEGSPDNPYEISWDLLTSAQQTFDPKAGKKKIPGVVAFLHRKFVRIRGYIAFPLQIKEPRELLSMLNQWDGCCIGVPPTPYDAIEVNLAKSVTGNARFATAGGITGKFLVKPYVSGDWLVGLYVLNQGAFASTDFGGSGENPGQPSRGD